MNIADFGTDANTLAQQVIDVKAYATANYNKNGWDIVIETMDDAQLAEVIGKRKNTRAAIYAAFHWIKPLHEHRSEQMANAKIENGAANGPVPVAEPTDEEMDPAAAKRAKRTAQQKARREAARAAKA